MVKEENPFESKKVAQEWIDHVENVKRDSRDIVIYPELRKWVKKINPKVIVEIGAGQGVCSDKINLKKSSLYIGVEPSKHLIKRAKAIYKQYNKKFLIGSAYKIPLRDSSADAVFSVNLWFHLKDLNRALYEFNRILKPRGSLFIITANPKAYHKWESFYFDYKKTGKKIRGKVKVHIHVLSSNVFYQHKLKEIKNSLRKNGLKILNIKEIGIKNKSKLFISILTRKV